jgi:N,N'-diacetyllegionaminate synthase
MKPSCYIIAEAGVNHNGSLEMARALIDAAADAGADAVKFQTFKADRLVTQAAAKADYQKQSGASGESQHAMLRKLELSDEAHLELVRHCRERGIQFLSTAFDPESAGFLGTLSLPFAKIPSGEITNLPHLRQTARSGCPVILSTGMSTLGEVEAALEVLVSEGIAREAITVLQCHTDYPTKFEDANLRAMQTMATAFPGVKIGYSDHTLGIEAPIAAVAMGACLIEKHFTLDRTLPGPDHAASLESAELKAMVSAIRNIELALGHGRKEPSASELKIRPIARKSIIASRPIQCGELLSNENLCVKRPGTGLSPMRWDELIGKPAKRAYEVDELIEPQ